MAGVDRKQRGKLLEEYVGVMRQAWSGEPFEWRGRTVRVTPKPQSEPMLLVGGSTEKAAKRAAQLRAGFFPAIGDAKLAEIYNAECQRLGFHGGFVSMPNGPGFVHVSEDPERDWQRIGPHALYDAQTYAAWQTPDQRSQMHVEAADDRRHEAQAAYTRPHARPVRAAGARSTAASSCTRSWAAWRPSSAGRACACSRRRCCRGSVNVIGARGDECADAPISPQLGKPTAISSALEDIEAIKQLKYRYWRHLDLKQWDELAQCFAADATVCYSSGKYEFRGVDAIMGFLSESLGERARLGDDPPRPSSRDRAARATTTARGTWALYNYMFNVKENRGIRIGAYYDDTYVKLDGAWKFPHIGYRTLFHEEWKRDDIPSLQLT